MNNNPFFALVICICLLSGCDSGETDKSERSEGVIPQHQLKALENAKKVEEILLETDKERQKALNK